MLQPLDIPYYLELQRRLENILLYVSCHENNFQTHSIKIENLFVDTCAFFESMCQSYLIENNNNGHKFEFAANISDFEKKVGGGKFFTIGDYRMILDNEFNLSGMNLNLNCYEDDYYGNPQAIDYPANINGYIIKPLERWGNDKTPRWWSAYNKLKHNRMKNIKKATLKNLINALGAAYLILTLRNELKFKKAKVPEDIYNVFYPKFWSYKGRVSRGIVKWH